MSRLDDIMNGSSSGPDEVIGNALPELDPRIVFGLAIGMELTILIILVICGV